MYEKNANGIFVNPADNPSHILIQWTNPQERPRELWLNRLNRDIAFIEVDGVRYVRACEYVERFEVLD